MSTAGKGSQLKLLIGFEYTGQGLTLDDIDYFVEFYCWPQNRQKILKSECTREVVQTQSGDVVNYYAIVNTNVTGAGHLKMVMTATIPDIAAPSGYRTEVSEPYVTNIIIV